MTDQATKNGPSGPTLILLASVIAGGCAYVLMPLAAAGLGSVAYAAFAVFWSGLYLVISALSGIQQEVARAARPREAGTGTHHRPIARNFAAAAATVVFVATVGTAALWVGVVFPADGWALVWPLAVGVASYVIVAVVGGVLYGLRVWPYIALMIGLDGVLRLILVVALLPFTRDLALIAWAVVIPFPVAPLIVWPFVRKRMVGRFELDVGYRALNWNVARTVVGSASTGVLVSGFPLLLGATSTHEPAGSIGALVLAITLTRAPIVIAVLSLQSYLVIYFRSHARSPWRPLLRVLAVIAVGTAALAGLAYWLGASAFALLGRDYEMDSALLAILVGSAGLVAALCATGPAVLSRSEHTIFTAGWLLAALATIALLFLPGDVSQRAVVALSVGPALGLVVHLVGLWRGNGAQARATFV